MRARLIRRPADVENENAPEASSAKPKKQKLIHPDGENPDVDSHTKGKR